MKAGQRFGLDRIDRPASGHMGGTPCGQERSVALAGFKMPSYTESGGRNPQPEPDTLTL